MAHLDTYTCSVSDADVDANLGGLTLQEWMIMPRIRRYAGTAGASERYTDPLRGFYRHQREEEGKLGAEKFTFQTNE